MKILRIDHFVLTVANIEASVKFYAEILGMTPTIFGKGRKAVKFGETKINFHEAGGEIKPHAAHATVGCADICLISDAPVSGVIEGLTRKGLTFINELSGENLNPQEAKILPRRISGAVLRTGALGAISSVYLRDPDGNLIEISSYE